MVDNTTVNPGTDTGAIVIATDEIAGVHYPIYKAAYGESNILIPVSAANPMPVIDNRLNIDSLGHLDVIAHAHAEGGHILFSKNFTANESVILIDLSNTTDYPHDNTAWIHTGNMVLNIAADSNTSEYTIDIGWVEDITAIDADFHKIFQIEGSKQQGNDHDIVITQNPEAPKLKMPDFLGPSVRDTVFNTGTTHKDSLDQVTGAVAPGAGDMVMKVGNVSGGVTVNIMVGYHSH